MIKTQQRPKRQLTCEEVDFAVDDTNTADDLSNWSKQRWRSASGTDRNSSSMETQWENSHSHLKSPRPSRMRHHALNWSPCRVISSWRVCLQIE